MNVKLPHVTLKTTVEELLLELQREWSVHDSEAHEWLASMLKTSKLEAFMTDADGIPSVSFCQPGVVTGDADG